MAAPRAVRGVHRGKGGAWGGKVLDGEPRGRSARLIRIIEGTPGRTTSTDGTATATNRSPRPGALHTYKRVLIYDVVFGQRYRLTEDYK